MKKYLPSLLLLVAAIAISRWVVGRLKTPGSMTVLESQTMNMNVKPPAGAVPVALERVTPDFFQPSVAVTGTVEAWANEEVVARVTGRVLHIMAYPGDRVLPGQLLVELDSQELQQRLAVAQAASEEARYRTEAAHRHHQRGELEQQLLRQEIRANQVAVEQAIAEKAAATAEAEYRQGEWGRADQLYRAGGLSQEEWQKARSDLTAARAQQQVKGLQIQRAQADLFKVQKSLDMQKTETAVFADEAAALRASTARNQAELAVAATQESYTRLTALNRGTVVERLVSPGTLVEPGQVLLRLRSTERLRLLARVPQDYSGLIEANARVQIKREGQEPLECRVAKDYLAADESTRTFTVEAQLDNRGGSSGLRVGSYVPMQIALARRKRRLTIPVPALQQDLEGKSFVWVAIPGRNEEDEKKTYYTCVMHPEVRSNGPGQCPKCQMALQPADPPGALRVVKREVQAGGSQGGRIAILDGLSPGDPVIVAGFQNLREGMRVIEVPWSGEGPVKLPPPPKDVRFDHDGMPMPEDYCSPTPGVSP